MTSVLATGAVANADQVTITENPANYINLQAIETSTGDPVDSSVKITPNKNFTDAGVSLYKLFLQVLEPEEDTLNQVAICLYDSASVTGDAMRTVCGDGATNPASIGDTSEVSGPFTMEGQDRPQMAHSMVFLPNRALTTAGDDSFHLGVNTSDDYHLLQERGASSWSTLGTTFDGQALEGSDEVWDLALSFGLNYKARMSDTWKIRVLATYNGSTQIELLDTTDYKVDYYGDITTRTSVTYPDVVTGGLTSDININTGQYTANAKSDVTIQAGVFQIEDDVNDPLSMGGTNEPGVDEVSLACIRKGAAIGPTDFFDAIDGAGNPSGKSSLTLLNNIDATNENDDDNAQGQLTAERHSCFLYVGDNVPVGTYDNDMTLGIGGV